ncbi:MAG: DUF222 domain-containing protein [Acidimicrobiia bacterium]|nr:DUF222 domain-containing protein [Acidimicrobiia bacterium]
MFDPHASTIPENLEDIPPGADLARVLDSLDWERLSDHDLIRVLQAQDRLVSHYQAGRAWTIDEITQRYQEGDREGSFEAGIAFAGAAAEVGAALCLTRRAAEIETGFSLQLLRYRPLVFEALLFGRIDMRRARVLVDSTLHLPDAIANAAIEQVLSEAPRLTTGQLRHRIAKLCIDADPDAARDYYDRSLSNRRFEVHPNESGTADILGLNVAPHIASSIRRWIHREAVRLKNLGDTRSMDQLRADIFTDLLRRRHRAGKITRADFGNLDMRVTAETLSGQSDEAGELNGFGPVIGDVARQVVEHQEHVDYRWTLVDPDTGLPVDGGTTQRRPTVSQRRQAEMLHPTCVHPGCRMPSTDCDLDHRQPWSEHRVTCTADLGPMCRHHHVIRHSFGWSYRHVADGDFEFTSPVGHRYTTSGREPANARAP